MPHGMEAAWKTRFTELLQGQQMRETLNDSQREAIEYAAFATFTLWQVPAAVGPVF